MNRATGGVVECHGGPRRTHGKVRVGRPAGRGAAIVMAVGEVTQQHNWTPVSDVWLMSYIKKNPHLILVKSKNSSKPPNTFQVIETKYFRGFCVHSFSHLVCFCFCIAWIYFEKKSILHNNIDHIIHIISNISIRKLKLNFLYTFISASENRYYKDLRWYLKNTNPCYFLDLTFFYNHMKLFYRWSNCFLAIGLCGPWRNIDVMCFYEHSWVCCIGICFLKQIFWKVFEDFKMH